MEKQDAAMDSRLPAFICATMSSRSVLLMLLINSIYLKQNPQAVSRQATKPLQHYKGAKYLLFVNKSGTWSKRKNNVFPTANIRIFYNRAKRLYKKKT